MSENLFKTYAVKVGDRTFQVQVGNVHARPVLAIVDGTEIEVWPENRDGIRPVAGATQSKPTTAAKTAGSKATVAAPPVKGGGRQVLAPIPGVILTVFVKVGDEINSGQELFLLEAMKMKNTIRANRAGTIASVCVTSGQTVNHNDVLLEYAGEQG